MAIDKARRQQALLELLREEEIGSQTDLQKALTRRGHKVTQATLSRDLKELRIPCVPTATGYRYLPPEETETKAALEAAPRQMQSVAALEVTGIDSNEIAVVVRTLTGRAQGVAVYIDSVRLPGVLATIAGDDTILVLPRSIRRTSSIQKQLAAILGL